MDAFFPFDLRIGPDIFPTQERKKIHATQLKPRQPASWPAILKSGPVKDRSQITALYGLSPSIPPTKEYACLWL